VDGTEIVETIRVGINPNRHVAQILQCPILSTCRSSGETDQICRFTEGDKVEVGDTIISVGGVIATAANIHDLLRGSNQDSEAEVFLYLLRHVWVGFL